MAKPVGLEQAYKTDAPVPGDLSFNLLQIARIKNDRDNNFYFNF